MLRFKILEAQTSNSFKALYIKLFPLAYIVGVKIWRLTICFSLLLVGDCCSRGDGAATVFAIYLSPSGIMPPEGLIP